MCVCVCVCEHLPAVRSWGHVCGERLPAVRGWGCVPVCAHMYTYTRVRTHVHAAFWVRASALVPGVCGCLNDCASGSARETQDTNGLLREELEGLQRRLGRQEKMQETLVDLELEKEVSQLVSVGSFTCQGDPTSQLIH